MIVSIHKKHPQYPERLHHLADPPEIIHCRGNVDLLTSPCVGVVGSRKMTSYGRRVLESMIPPLVATGCTIVSGLAFGVDAYAHELTLRHRGNALAVLGSGIEEITPAAHLTLGTAIAKRGLVVSEYPGHTPGHKSHFPARNRIIAGLSNTLLIIEAGMRSGSLITADFMLQLGKDVFAVPGNIDAPLSTGTNFLIQHGAQLCTDAQDILLALGFDKPLPSHVSSDVSPDTQRVLDLLSQQPYTIDELVARGGIALEQVLSIITQLELDAHISASADGKLHLKK